MFRKIIAGCGVALGLSLAVAPVASADEPTSPKPPPLSAAGLGIKVPKLSAEGLLGKKFVAPPLSAKGIFIILNGKKITE